MDAMILDRSFPNDVRSGSRCLLSNVPERPPPLIYRDIKVSYCIIF